MNWKPVPKPETYQDVKITLTWYTSIVLLACIVITLWYLFGNTFKQWLTDPKQNWLRSLGSGFGVMGFSGFFGFVLIFLFEVHDKVYDRYFVRWRYYYDLDFILPRLTMPFMGKLSKLFFLRAEKDLYDFMKPFYVFVADGEGETKVSKNLCIRFYERALKYWITQINELILTFLFFTIILVKWIHLSSSEKLLNTFIVIAVLFLINKLFVKSIRKSIRQATGDEIEEIHSKFYSQLEGELKTLHDKFDLKYGEV